VQDPALVPTAVAAVLGMQQAPGLSMTESLAATLARQQILLVLDNCEHVLDAAAELCAALLPVADDMRILATSRERTGVAGEARYRLPPLALAGTDATGAVADSEAVALFADRARQADPHFSLAGETGPVVARLVARLDGMPLAIELAAARVEALGVNQLLDRLDHRFGLLTGGDRTAATRQRSLAATVDWSYQLLGEDEQQAFGRLAIFPGPFTLDAAEAVAGARAEDRVLHLVDCSLLTPPRSGPDGRARYLMLETLRAFGLERLTEAGQQAEAAAALASYALQVAEKSAAGLRASSGEMAAAAWLDAEEAVVHQALAWALEHDPDAALRLAIALSPWWEMRGRRADGYMLLSAAAQHAAPGSDGWCSAQLWLGRSAGNTGDFAGAVGHFTAVRDAAGSGMASPTLADALSGRSVSLMNLGRFPEAAEDAHHSLAVARKAGYPAGQVRALMALSLTAHFGGGPGNALRWARQAERIDPAGIPGSLARMRVADLTLFLMEADDVASARGSCADGLARARESGHLPAEAIFLSYLADLDRRSGRQAEAGTHLREALELAARIGDRLTMIECLDYGGYLCAATGRRAEAVTLWTAFLAFLAAGGGVDQPEDAQRRQDQLRKAAQALGPARTRQAEERGAAMVLETAVDFAIILADAGAQAPDAPPGLGHLTPRERELVTLVAQGRTDAQIAGRLHISVSTVRSHLDRIRDKTSCRRRTELTRLALQAGLA